MFVCSWFFFSALTSLMYGVRQLLRAVSLSFLLNLDRTMPFSWPQGKRPRGVRLAWSALKLDISFFVLSYGAHYASMDFTHAAFSVEENSSVTWLWWESNSTLNRNNCRKLTQHAMYTEKPPPPTPPKRFSGSVNMTKTNLWFLQKKQIIRFFFIFVLN